MLRTTALVLGACCAAAALHFSSSNMKALIQQARRELPALFKELPETVGGLGYPVETHRVHTADGYILTVHRIPSGRGRAAGRASLRPPVLLQHGWAGSSESWTVGGIGIAPALIMADSGYDVWIGNSRGNYYSRHHVNMTIRNPAYWRFSWHEMGLYDIPAVIDHVLATTGQARLHYVGHSMGNNMFYVMLSFRPEYNAKVKLEVALAPSVYWDNVRSQVARFIMKNTGFIRQVMEKQSTFEMLEPSDGRIAFYYFGCRRNSTALRLCNTLMALAIGRTEGQSNLPLYLARMLGASSAWTMLHLGQNAKTGRFQQFDFGRAENSRRYGSPTPPQYDLQKVTLPVAVYTSRGDDLVPYQGVERLARELPNVVDLYTVPVPVFNHLDFLAHDNVRELLIDRVLSVMGRYP